MKIKQIAKKTIVCSLVAAIVVSTPFTNTGKMMTYAAIEEDTITNYVTGLDVEYIGGIKDIGDTVTTSEFRVIAKLKNGSRQELNNSEFTLKSNRLTGERTNITAVYVNAKGTKISRSVAVPADLMIKKIDVSYDTTRIFDAGDPLPKSIFTVTATQRNGEVRVLKADEYDISTNITSTKSDTTSVKFTYTNNVQKTYTKTLFVKSNAIITSFDEITYTGVEKNIGDTVSLADFHVTGKTRTGEVVTIPSSNLNFVDNTNRIEKESNIIGIRYTNSLGKTITRFVPIKAGLMIRAITSVEYIGKSNEKDDSVSDLQVGDTITKDELAVTATLVNGSTKTLTDFQIENPVIEKTSQTINISYVNELEKKIKKSFTVKSTDPVVSVSAEAKNGKKFIVGDPVLTSMFTTKATYGTGKISTLTDFGISPQTIPADGNFTISYGNKSCTLHVETIRAAGSITATCQKNYYIGDRIAKEDFTVQTDSGKTLSSDQYSISRSTASSTPTTPVTITYKNEAGIARTATVYVNTYDWISSVDIRLSGKQASEAKTINSQNLKNYINLTAKWKSGTQTPIDPSSDIVSVTGPNGEIINSGNGSMTLSGDDRDNEITVTVRHRGSDGNEKTTSKRLKIKATLKYITSMKPVKKTNYKSDLFTVKSVAYGSSGKEMIIKINVVPAKITKNSTFSGSDIAAMIDFATKYKDGSTKNLSFGSDYEMTSNETVRPSATATVSASYTLTTSGRNGNYLSDAVKPWTSKISVTILPVETSSITLSKTSAKLNMKEKLQLNAKIAPAGAGEATWKSSDTKVATVDDNGLVVTVGEGTCIITASSGAKKATCKITVTDNTKPTKTSVKLAKTSIKVGETTTAKGTVLPSAASQKVTWYSTNENIAKVDANGKVTGIAAGKCKIVAYAGTGKSSGIRGEQSITVTKQTSTSGSGNSGNSGSQSSGSGGSQSGNSGNSGSSSATVKSLTVSASPRSLTIDAGKTSSATLTAKSGTSSVAGTTYNVKCSNTNVATASVNGGRLTVSGKKAGTATITVTASKSGFKDGKTTVSVTIKDLPKEKATLTLNKTSVTLNPTLGVASVSCTYKNGSGQPTVTSSNSNVKAVLSGNTITITHNLFQPKADVTATVKVKYGSVSKNISVKVKKYVKPTVTGISYESCDITPKSTVRYRNGVCVYSVPSYASKGTNYTIRVKYSDGSSVKISNSSIKAKATLSKGINKPDIKVTLSYGGKTCTKSFSGR